MCFRLLISRIFGMGAPFVAELNAYYPRLDCLVLGALALAAGVLNAIFLPETTGRKTPESVQDVLDLFKKAPREVK